MANGINNYQSFAEAIIERAARKQHFSEEGLGKLKNRFLTQISNILENQFLDSAFTSDNLDHLNILADYYGSVLADFLLNNNLIKDSKKLFNRNIKTLNISSANINSDNETLTTNLGSFQKNWMSESAKDIDFIRFLLINDKTHTRSLIRYYIETAFNKNLEASTILGIRENLNNPRHVAILIENYVETAFNKNQNISSENFSAILNLANQLNRSEQYSLIINYLNRFSGEEKLSHLILILNNVRRAGSEHEHLKFDPKLVIKIFSNTILQPSQNVIQSSRSTEINHLEQLIYFVQTLHPDDEESQGSTLKIAIEKGLITKNQLFNIKTRLENFDQQENSSNQPNSLNSNSSLQEKNVNQNFLKYINEAKSHHLVKQLLISLQDKGLLRKEAKTLLSLVKGRTALQFEFIKEFLEAKTTSKEDLKQKSKVNEDEIITKDLSDFLTNEGLIKLCKLFGENYLKENNINILDIISYYDVINHINNLTKILKPEFTKALRENLTPSKNILLIKPEEITKLSQLTETNSNEIEAKFIKTKVLCNYFLEKINIPNLSAEERQNYQVNLEKYELFDEEMKQEFNKKFREILNSSDLTVDKVFEVFRMIIDDDGNSVNGKNQNKIFKLFERSKNEIAHLFNKEDGLSDFRACLSTVTHGCSANIGNQFSIALYQSLLKEQKDVILYPILMHDIVREIMNKNGSDVIGSQSNPLKNTIVANYLISPEALFDKICNSFIGDEQGSKGKDPWQFIADYLQKEKGFNEDSANQVRDILFEKISGENARAREIATYLILSETIGKKEVRKVGIRAEDAKNNLREAISEYKNENKTKRTTPSRNLNNPKVEQGREESNVLQSK